MRKNVINFRTLMILSVFEAVSFKKTPNQNFVHHYFLTKIFSLDLGCKCRGNWLRDEAFLAIFIVTYHENNLKKLMVAKENWWLRGLHC